MAAVFLAGWIVCLGESMAIWHNKWTCLGVVICPRKPHPFGNEYHGACCGLLTIMFVIKMVEGKDAPSVLCQPFVTDADVIFWDGEVHCFGFWLLRFESNN